MFKKLLCAILCHKYDIPDSYYMDEHFQLYCKRCGVSFRSVYLGNALKHQNVVDNKWGIDE